MASPNTLPDDIWIEYDSRGKRARKHFTEKFAARRFWTQKDRDGKHPKVIKPETPAERQLRELGLRSKGIDCMRDMGLI